MRIAVVADLHLTDEFYLEGIDPRLRAEATIEDIAQQPVAPELLVNLGDTVDKGRHHLLSWYDGLVLGALGSTTAYNVTGNHELAAAVNASLRSGPKSNCLEDEAKESFIFRAEDRVFIVLDGRVPDYRIAEVGPIGRDWLEEVLTREVKSHEKAVILSHFPLREMAPGLSPRLIVRDSAEVIGILERSGKVEAVLSGHIHKRLEDERNGIKYLSLPSTANAIDRFEDGRAMPDLKGLVGYTLLDFNVGGSFAIEYRHIEHE